VAEQASHHLPASPDSMYLDYQPLGPVPGDEGNRITVLLVACKREVVDSRLRALEAAGLTASVVDGEPFAVEGAFGMAEPPGAAPETVALLNAGARTVNLNVVNGGQSVFARDHHLAGPGLAERLAREQGTAMEEAEARLQGGGEDGVAGSEALAAFLEELAAQVKRGLAAFQTAHPGQPLHRAVVCGGCALLPGVTDALSAALGLPTTVLDPFRGLDRAKGVDSAGAGSLGPRLAVATGLALRTFDP
jgi:type IV pilus assembly protein PilM